MINESHFLIEFYFTSTSLHKQDNIDKDKTISLNRTFLNSMIIQFLKVNV